MSTCSILTLAKYSWIFTFDFSSSSLFHFHAVNLPLYIRFIAFLCAFMLLLMTVSYCEDNCTVIFICVVNDTSIKDSSSMKVECLQICIKLTVLMKSIILSIWIFIYSWFSIDLLMIVSWNLFSAIISKNV